MSNAKTIDRAKELDWEHKFLADYGHEFHRAQPSGVGALKELRKAKATLRAHVKEEVTKGKLEGRISGLKTAHRYKGNPFEVGEKILKEIARLQHQLNKGVE